MTLGQRVAVMRDGKFQQVDTPQHLYRLPRQPLRRGVHRLAADEPRRGGGPDAARHVRRASACRCRPAASARAASSSGSARRSSRSPRTDPEPAGDRGRAGGRRGAGLGDARDLPDRRTVGGQRRGARDDRRGDSSVLLASNRRALFTASLPEGTQVEIGQPLRLALNPARTPLLRPRDGRAARPRTGHNSSRHTGPRMRSSHTLRLWLIAVLVVAAVISVIGNKATRRGSAGSASSPFLVALFLYVSWRRAALKERRSTIRTADEPDDETRTRTDQ